MAKTRAQQNRAIRQESLRELLASQGHLQHVIDLCCKLAELDTILEPSDINRLKIVIDTKLALIKKYLPDLKSTEITGDAGGSITINVADYSGKQ